MKGGGGRTGLPHHLHKLGGLVVRLGRVRRLEHFSDLVLGEAPLDPPVEVLPRRLPVQNVPDDPLSLHATGAVVEVRELVSHLFLFLILI